MRFAPCHEVFPTEASIGAQKDAHPRPALAYLADDPRHLRDRPRGPVDVRAAQLGRQQMPPAEHVKRQIAVAVIVAVEETALLMAVQRVVSGVEIEDDLPGRLVVRLQEQIDEQPLDRGPVMADLVIAGRLGAAQLEPVQRRFPGDRRARLAPRRELAGQNRHHRIVAQLVMIDQILVTQRDPKHPLADQRANLMLDENCRTHNANRPTRPIARSAAPSSNAPASDVIAPPSNEATTSRPSTRAKPNKSAVHSVSIGASPWTRANRCSTTIFSESALRCTYPM